MPIGRVRQRLLVGIATAIICTAVASGCASEDDRTNELRPPVPVTVSVNIESDAVSVSPRRVASVVGGESRAASDDPNANVIYEGGPIPIDLAISNTLDRPVRVEVSGLGAEAGHASEVVTPTGTLVMGVELETGRYEITVPAVGRNRPGRLRVGPIRVSPQNALMLP